MEMLVMRLYPTLFTDRIYTIKLLPSTSIFTHLPSSSSHSPPHFESSLPLRRSLPSLLSSSPLLNGHYTSPKSKYLSSISSISASDSSGFTLTTDESGKDKLLQVSKRLERTSIYFKKLGGLGIWCQLLSAAIAAALLSFSVVITGKIVSPVTFYATSFGIVAALVSVFWSFGYIRIAENLWKTAKDPSKAPGREEVVKSLRNGIGMNAMGMSAAVAGMLVTTTGLLLSKVISTSNYNPQDHHSVTLDVFLLLQASVSTIVSLFLGLLISLELLRYICPPPSAQLGNASSAAAS